MGFASKTVAGSVEKTVMCRCGYAYRYELKRVGWGTVSDQKLSDEEAEALAQKEAEAKLKTLLKSECDIVACPGCRSISDEMRKSRRTVFIGSITCIGVGLGILLAVGAVAYFLDRLMIAPGVVGIALLLLGLALLVFAFRKLFPRKGKL